jgi:hypothetical protein
MSLFVDCQQITIIRECFFGLPRGLGDWVTFPFDQVLIRLSSSSMFQDRFHVIHFFSIKNVRNWSGEVFSMYFCFDVGLKKYCMKNIINSPCCWQFQSICDRSQDFFDFECSFLLWCHLLVVVCLHIPSVQPDLLSNSKWSERILSSVHHSCSCQFMGSQSQPSFA